MGRLAHRVMIYVNDNETAEKYSGKRVAIHPTEGVIAFGDSLGEVHDQVKEHPDLEDILFHSFPDPDVVYIPTCMPVDEEENDR